MLLVLLLIVVVLPAVFGWTLGRLFRPQHEFMVACWALLAAALPNLMLFLLAQQGDAINAAASYAVVPAFVLISWIPAGIGCSIGKKRQS
jgi:hypothetical protein